MSDYPLPYNSTDLAGRVALVTGGSRNISGKSSGTEDGRNQPSFADQFR